MKKLILILIFGLEACATHEQSINPITIDHDGIEIAIRKHRDEFRYCYERELNQGKMPIKKGIVYVQFMIQPSGSALDAKVFKTTLNYVNVENCILYVISRIQFPLPSGNQPVTVKYPFSFANQKKK